MTKEEIAIKYGHFHVSQGTSEDTPYIQIPNEMFLSDLNALIREELIKFCRERLPSDILFDEVIFIDEYLKSQQ
jgi:hypothetical protein